MMEVEGCEKLEADILPSARSYQIEALQKALERNTIVFLETGAGKTLIAVMLFRSYASLLREPSPYIAVFLVPTVVLVTQQCEVVQKFTDLKVGKYYGDMGVDFWDSDTWKHEIATHEVLVMTPQILLNALRHSFLSIRQIKVLVMDECHHAIRKHPYALIMKEFYHRKLEDESLERPQIFGMTASPIKTKVSTEGHYSVKIKELENLLNSKIFTCESAQFAPRKEPKVKFYNHKGIPQLKFEYLVNNLTSLAQKHELSLGASGISDSRRESARNKLKIFQQAFEYCLSELGILFALKAAEADHHAKKEFSQWHGIKYDDKFIRAYCLDVQKLLSENVSPDFKLSTADDLTSSLETGYITSRVYCLVETLLDYREIKDLRCIVFVNRIVSAISISKFLNEISHVLSGWRSEYAAGNASKLKSQSRTEQNTIVNKFRDEKVNIIVATSMLEEGLDVPSCNLVIRFDPAATICSFIQSRGRARMESSDFVIMVKRDDSRALSSLENCINGENVMRRECLQHADATCEETDNEVSANDSYRVERTGAVVTLNSSVSLIHFYCSRLPSDGYFKPSPRFSIDQTVGSCTLYLPNSCPIQSVSIDNVYKSLKQTACLEACKQLHKVGALTHNLIPDIVEEEADAQELGVEHPFVECENYIPSQLVGTCGGEIKGYECYLIELKPDFQYDVDVRDIMLVVHAKLDSEIGNLNLKLDTDKGNIVASLKYIGGIVLSHQQVTLCQKFQLTLFRILLDHKLERIQEEVDAYSKMGNSMVFNYLLLPSVGCHPNILVDWECVSSCLNLEDISSVECINCYSQKNHANYVHTRSGLVRRCLLENSLVCTPHNGYLYCVVGSLEEFNGFTCFELRDGGSVSYKEYYKKKFGIKLQYEQEAFFKAKRIFTVKNFLKKLGSSTSKENSNTTYELPPEVCRVVMSPISVSTFYSFSFLPSIMHWIESFLIASDLRSFHADGSEKSIYVSSSRVLEAITTKKCQENYDLESLETLGDSFLKYAASQQLFCSYQNHHEGILSIKRKKLISNASLCELGWKRGITGFIRNEPFDPKTWSVPGSNCIPQISKKELLPSKIVYCKGSVTMKSKSVADLVEALIGAYLLEGGELAAISFMSWLGITINFVNIPYMRNFAKTPESHINVKQLESVLNYTFRDASLLVEALTHGSYMIPEIPRCYQRLEFLGDAVLDYLISIHLYKKFPNMSPGLLTELRSASVNNDCYARSAMKMQLYKHVLHCSLELQSHMESLANTCEDSSTAPTFGWDSETTFPKVLADVIESLAGAILVDSGYDTDIVFQTMRPLLEPLVTPETLKRHPVPELNEICQKEDYTSKLEFSVEKQIFCATVEVDAAGVVHTATGSGENKKSAKRLASRAVLKSIKGCLEGCKVDKL